MPENAWSGIAYAIRGDIVKFSVDQMINNQDTPVKYPAFRLALRGFNEFGVKWIKKNHPDETVPENIFGMIILEVEEDSWADQHGIQLFDILIAVDGEPINNMLDVRNIVMGRDYKPGRKVDLLVIRDGHFRKIPYELTWIDFDSYEDFYDESMDKKEMPRIPTPTPQPPADDEPSMYQK
jgi:serine protease Do